MTYIITAQTNIEATCAWTLLHLLRNLESLIAFEAEVKANPPVNGIYPMSKMPFGEACLRETGRLYNNPIIVRYNKEDFETSSGLVIPKGWVAISPVTVQMDPEFYDEPDTWSPRRFLPLAGGGDLYAKRFRDYAFVQFGAGNNVCPGIKLTNSLLRASLWPALLDNYRLELVQDSIVEGKGIDGVGILPDYAKNVGSAPGLTEPYIRVIKREVPLSSTVKDE